MDFDPFDRRYFADPYPVYSALRNQQTLHYCPETKVFCVTRYDEAEAVFKQPELFSSRAGFNLLFMSQWERIGLRDLVAVFRFLIKARINPLRFKTAPESILTSDPPVHGPLRNIVNRGFTPRRIAAWESRIRELSVEFTSDIRADRGFDVVEKLAHPLPMTIISEIIGVDANRLEDFRRWSSALIDNFTGAGREGSPGAMLDSAGELVACLRSVVEARRKQPTDDLISILVDPKHGEPLVTPAVILFAIVLLVAGNETVTSTIGNTVDYLLRDPALLDRVAQDPSLISDLVEESVRLESPFRFMPRTAMSDTEIRNTKIPKGSNVVVMIGAANRDERRFEKADRVVLERKDKNHLGFGYGIHFCLGGSLARLEARIALETLVPILRDRALVKGGHARSDSYFTRGFSRLEISPAIALEARRQAS